MDEGKRLLTSIIEDKLSKLSVLDTKELYIDNTNLKTLQESINQDINNFYDVKDSIISEIVSISNTKNKDELALTVRSARDLLIGKKEYNLNVRLTQEHIDAINIFKKSLDKKLKSLNPEVVSKEEIIKKLNYLKKQVDSNFLINDFKTIESIVRDYDKINYDKNMLIIMQYINSLNINLMKTKKKNAPIFDIQMIKRPKIDPIVKDILKKLDIKTKEIPNFLLSELKKCEALEFECNYKIIKKNKAEVGGILHFIEKDNIIGRLAILLYATPASIIEVINSLRDETGLVNIPLLKLIVNKIPVVFLVKNNTYYKPKFEDFINNMKLLRELNVNYAVLIKRNPIFMLTENKVLEYTLDYLEKLGANKKDVINRCYKTLATNPSLIIDNIEVMKKYNIDLTKFFGVNNTNYNLLKMGNLDHKLKIIKLISDVDFSNLEALNKIIITKIYKESKAGYINWGDIR